MQTKTRRPFAHASDDDAYRARIAVILLERATGDLEELQRDTEGDVRRGLDDILWMMYAALEELRGRDPASLAAQIAAEELEELPR